MRHAKIIIALSAIVLFAGSTFAQNTSSSFATRTEQMRNAHKQRTQAAKERYSQFRDKCNQEYAKWLRGEWGSATLEISEDTAKPRRQIDPVDYKEEDSKMLKSQTIAEEVSTDFLFFFSKAEPIDDIMEVTSGEDRGDEVMFLFYGTPVSVRVNKKIPQLKNCNGNAIAQVWEKLSEKKFNNIVYDCLQLKKNLNLCDWAYLQMIDTLSHTVFAADANSANLLIGYIYAQSGYKIKFAHYDGILYLLYASNAPLKGRPCLDINGERYYVHNPGSSIFSIIKKEFPVSPAAMENESPVSFSIEKNQNFTLKDTPQRTFKGTYSNGIEAHVSTNDNLIDFYRTYPAFSSSEGSANQWIHHANTPLSEKAKADLYPAIEKYIAGKDTLTALSGILNFIHFGFPYKVDREAWGQERVFFAEETLYYPFSDCEDRAILFSRIVRDLLHMDVILVHYPNHLGCAVKIDKNVYIPGDYIILGEDEYLVCDPTYRGAPAGCAIPEFKNASSKAIKLK